MLIHFKLNDEEYKIQADPAECLANVLRKEKLYSVKNGCMQGSCGACYVLLDGKAVPSCHIPVGIVIDSSITTLEHFSKSEIYSEITKGFEKAGVSLCGFCDAGKIFLTYEILTTLPEPNRERIKSIICRLNDCCVEQNTLINGIIYAYSIHFDKEKLRKHGHR